MTTPVQTSATAQHVKIGAGFWVCYIFLIFYIAVSANAVTNVDLLLENRVKLTFLDRDLPLVGFFSRADPFHRHAYIRHVETRDARRQSEKISQSAGTD
jgi:hypothetical protein